MITDTVYKDSDPFFVMAALLNYVLRHTNEYPRALKALAVLRGNRMSRYMCVGGDSKTEKFMEEARLLEKIFKKYGQVSNREYMRKIEELENKYAEEISSSNPKGDSHSDESPQKKNTVLQEYKEPFEFSKKLLDSSLKITINSGLKIQIGKLTDHLRGLMKIKLVC